MAKKKARAKCAGLVQQGRFREFRPRQGITASGCLDVRGLFTLRTLGDFERHLLTFFQRLEAVHLNRRKMGEKIFAAIIRRDETVALGVIEPFHSASCHMPALIEKRMGSAICSSSKDRTGQNLGLPWSCDEA